MFNYSMKGEGSRVRRRISLPLERVLSSRNPFRGKEELAPNFLGDGLHEIKEMENLIASMNKRLEIDTENGGLHDNAETEANDQSRDEILSILKRNRKRVYSSLTLIKDFKSSSTDSARSGNNIVENSNNSNPSNEKYSIPQRPERTINPVYKCIQQREESNLHSDPEYIKIHSKPSTINYSCF